MNMTPQEYYNMLPKDYYAKVDGYNNKQRFKAELIRQHAFITVSPYIKQGTTYNSFKGSFPLPFDEIIEQVQRKTMTKEEMEALLKQVNEAEQKSVENG